MNRKIIAVVRILWSHVIVGGGGEWFIMQIILVWSNFQAKKGSIQNANSVACTFHLNEWARRRESMANTQIITNDFHGFQRNFLLCFAHWMCTWTNLELCEWNISRICDACLWVHWLCPSETQRFFVTCVHATNMMYPKNYNWFAWKLLQ